MNKLNTCFRCHKVIEGEWFIDRVGRAYCSYFCYNHWLCFDCRKPFTFKNIIFDKDTNRPYCISCYRNNSR